MNAAPRTRVRVLAPCKLNPTLVVVARRPDGFHEVALTYLALDLADELAVLRTEGGECTLHAHGPQCSGDVPSGAQNLAWRAAHAVLECARADGRWSARDGLALELDKRVPSRAGLGGGSSDAAAAAYGACLVSGVAPDDPRVARALAALGSDCAFFLAARASGHARGRGRGERIAALPALGLSPWVVLATPEIGASTAAVYGALAARGSLGDPDGNQARARAAEEAWTGAQDVAGLRAALVDDLEAAALDKVPGLADWRALLDARGFAHFRLAGSGSSFFGLFETESEARAAESSLARHALAAGLGLRGTWVTRPAGHGARAAD